MLKHSAEYRLGGATSCSK